MFLGGGGGGGEGGEGRGGGGGVGGGGGGRGRGVRDMAPSRALTLGWPPRTRVPAADWVQIDRVSPGSD